MIRHIKTETGARFFTVLGAAIMFVVANAPAAHAQLDLYDFALNTSNGVTGDWQDTSTFDPTNYLYPTSAIYGDTSCCGDATGGTTPGIGKDSYVFTPGAPGTYSVSLYFDYDVNIPDYNEYGTINNAGAAQSGVTGEIFNANSPTSNIVLFGACGTPGCETYGLANGANNVPGTASNFLDNCTSAGCNADVGLALTYSFTLSAGQYAVIKAFASTTNPGGFSLQDTHPVDTNNAAAASVYLYGTYGIFEVQTGTPEPSTWILLGTGFALLGVFGFWRKARV